MKLYEINQAIEELLNREVVDLETGEVLDVDSFEDLKRLELERDLKIEGIGLYLKNIESEVTALKAEEKKLADRRKVKENKFTSLKSFLSGYLSTEDLKKFETPKLKLSFIKSESTNVTDKSKLPKKFIKTDVITSPLKNDIKKALKAGEDVPGAELVESQNLQIK